MASTVSIRAIGKDAVHRICSGQVILNLATAVKELVENALDAGATNIEVRLREHGSSLIEVADNGKGIAAEDFQNVTLKHHTSKLQQFSDLQALDTFGFRGEALSSLCSVAGVAITTRAQNASAGTRLTYDAQGRIVAQEAIARACGTTVAVKDLFKPLPVRHKEFNRNIKREFAKLLTVLQAYALVATRVRIICTNQVGSGTRATVLQAPGAATLREGLGPILGARGAAAMEPLDIEVPGGARLTGFVSRGAVAMAKTACDRQFFFVNGRPVDMPKAVKLLNDLYRSLSSAANAHCRPMAVLDLQCPRDSYDINVTPDKRKALLHSEDAMLQALKQALSEMWEPTRHTFAVGGASQRPPEAPQPRRARRRAAGPEEDSASTSSEDGSDGGRTAEADASPCAATEQPSARTCAAAAAVDSGTEAGEDQVPIPAPSASIGRGRHSDQDRPEQNPLAYSELQAAMARAAAVPPATNSPGAQDMGTSDASGMDGRGAWGVPGEEVFEDCLAARTPSLSSQLVPGIQGVCEVPHLEPRAAKRARISRQEVTARLDLDAISQRLRTASATGGPGPQGTPRGSRAFRQATLQDSSEGIGCGSDESAEEELERVFAKADFGRLAERVVGQFNLGFVLARLGRDLFIIDQHAADEKANFERLARTTRLNRQPLLQPRPLHLTAAEVVAVLEHRGVLQANGFDVREAPAGGVLLTAVPFSKDTTFDASDAQELVHLLAHGAAVSADAQRMPRPSRVRAMLAMRACRSSIMIGRPLDRGAMARVLRSLSDLDSPWNCPHGRPTMRHLAVL